MLLSDLVDQNDFASSLPEFQINQRTWNRGEQKHICKYEYYEVDVVRLEVLNCQDVVIWIRVIGREDVHYENHLREIAVVILVGIYILWKVRVNIAGIKS